MNLPSDLSEGWWWVRSTEEEPVMTMIVWSKATKGWHVFYAEDDVWVPGVSAAITWTAMERVQPPSWEKG